MKSRFRDLMLLHFLNDGVRTTFVVLLVYIAKDFHMPYSMVGFLGSSQPFLAAVLAFPAGYIISRMGELQLLTKLVIIYSLGALSLAIAPNIIIIIIAFLISAVGFGMFHAPGFVLIAKISEKGKEGRNMGDFAAVGDLGRIMLPPFALYLASVIGWRTTVFMVAAAGFIVYGIARQIASSADKLAMKKRMDNHVDYKDFIKQVLYMMRTKKVFLILLSSIFDALASSPIFVFLPFLLLQKGVTPLELSIITGGFFVGSFGGKVLLGRAADANGNKKTFIFSEVGMGLTVIFIILNSSFFSLFLSTMMLGAFTRGTFPVLQTMLSKRTHADHYNKIFAISEFFVGFAAMFTLVGMGFVADHFGVSVVFYLATGLAICAIIPILLVPRVTYVTENK